MKHRYHTVTFPLSEQREVPEGIMSLAARRTEHLHRILPHRSIADVLANAYMQGMNDALDTAATHPGIFTDPVCAPQGSGK